MRNLVLILGDQLNQEISSLHGFDASQDCVLMAEVWDEATYVKHHKKKIAFLFSAMRHFAGGLADEGISTRYVKLDDPDNGGSLEAEVKRALEAESFEKIIVTKPGEYRLLDLMQTWDLGPTIELHEDDRFLCSTDDFAALGMRSQLLFQPEQLG